jgi:protein gp37
MAAHNTGIEWTHIPGFKGETWNPVVGCSVISPGCTNCYAMRLAGARLDGNPNTPHYAGTTQPSKAGPVWSGKLAHAPEQTITAPLRWRKPRAVFVNSMGDLFHEDAQDWWIDLVFAVMALCPQHVFIILTKRSARMREYLEARTAQVMGPDVKVMLASPLADAMQRVSLWRGDAVPMNAPLMLRYPDTSGDGRSRWPLPNVWLGVSVEDQTRADERIPDLLNTPAAVRLVSCEPLLGPLWLPSWLPAVHDPYLEVQGAPMACLGCDDGEGFAPPRCASATDPRLACPENRAVIIDHEGPEDPETGGPRWVHTERVTLDWVIAGGESGKGARPVHPDWIRSLRDQCAAAGTPFFFKQWGEYFPGHFESGEYHPDIDMDPFVLDHARGQKVSGFSFDDGQEAGRIGKRAAGRTLDGQTHDAFPAGIGEGAR